MIVISKVLREFQRGLTVTSLDGSLRIQSVTKNAVRWRFNKLNVEEFKMNK